MASFHSPVWALESYFSSLSLFLQVYIICKITIQFLEINENKRHNFAHMYMNMYVQNNLKKL
jgi:hypothetical protein